MKIPKDSLVRIEDDPLELFYQGIRTSATKASYTRKLRKVLCEYLEDILEGSFEKRAAQLVYKAKADPEEALRILLSLSKALRQRTELDPLDSEYLNPSSIKNFFNPVRKLLDMNGVAVAWKRVQATFPEQNNLDESRGYTRQEIQKMLEFSDALERAIILVAASSGARVGGLRIRWEDLTPVYRVDNKLVLEDVTESEASRSEIACAVLTIYRRTNEKYPAFITPEAYKAILNYRTAWINEIGKEPKPTDPLFKKSGLFAKPLKDNGIRKRVERIVKKSELRSNLVKMRRHDVPAMNGFRRFFNKSFKESPHKDSSLAALIKAEFVMGHRGLTKLDRNYFKTNLMELVEEYVNAVPNLTISDEERSKLEIRKQQKRIAELEIKNAIIEDLQKRVRMLEKTRLEN